MQRFAERGGHCDLGVGVDLDVIEKSADHAVERASVDGRPPVGEGDGEGLGARTPSGCLGGRVAPICVGALDGFFCAAQRSGLVGEAGRDRRTCIDLGAQRRRRAFRFVGVGPMRFDRRQLGRDLCELMLHLRQVGGDRVGVRVALDDVALGLGELRLRLPA